MPPQRGSETNGVPHRTEPPGRHRANSRRELDHPRVAVGQVVVEKPVTVKKRVGYLMRPGISKPVGKGKLVISYNSLDELDGILEHIQ